MVKYTWIGYSQGPSRTVLLSAIRHNDFLPYALSVDFVKTSTTFRLPRISISHCETHPARAVRKYRRPLYWS